MCSIFTTLAIRYSIDIAAIKRLQHGREALLNSSSFNTENCNPKFYRSYPLKISSVAKPTTNKRNFILLKQLLLLKFIFFNMNQIQVCNSYNPKGK